MIEVQWKSYDFAEKNKLCTFCIEGEDLPIDIEAMEEIVRDDVLKNKYLFAGDYHQCGDHGVPIVYKNDVAVGALCYSMRRWGAFMAEIWGHNHVMAYMDFYMTQCIPKYMTEKLPEGE